MRIEGTTELWWVTNPTGSSKMEDICFSACLNEAQNGFGRNLEGLTLYSIKEEAERDARIRLNAMEKFQMKYDEAKANYGIEVIKGRQYDTPVHRGYIG